ncbi:YdeI/OmpD-associated family protein [Leptospira yasudae]|uniref:Bacteriocin-protection protein n=1 Tax=Leptospira yasudae TaxID=2202201 RepID=A0A6N4R133_9LEPT|nr:YdeI/OmpD-associated family protein [Leptospira yasudae]TGL80354.1 bacteriocin-protection protein [Leptospira yasudae]TGL81870.1 bacteriocin-protection protein [Leptospira yasudae]TGL89543.1 bacteriocin-protection protein [Leptospira yasudae]
MKEIFNDCPVLFFKNRKEWATWLKANHRSDSAIWIKLAKKESSVPSITYAEALEVALCYGWIDSQKQKYDASHWLQRFSIRGSKSIWSKINREKAEQLIASKEMKAPGLAAVEAAKKDGRWDKAYASQSKMEVPEEFQKLLDKNSSAKKFFETLNSTNRYAILFRIHNAKKEETKIKRMKEFVEMLKRKETLH